MSEHDETDPPIVSPVVREAKVEQERRIDARVAALKGGVLIEAMLEEWDRGFRAAVELARSLGGVTIAEDMEKALQDHEDWQENRAERFSFFGTEG